MNTFMNEPYVPQTVKDEEEYIRSGIATYGYEGFWTIIDELNKKPFKPYRIKLIRRKFPQLSMKKGGI